MIVKLIKTKEGKTAGYTMIAETKEYKLILGSIRSLEFWGDKTDKPQYDGINTEHTPEGEYVIELSYVNQLYKNEKTESIVKKYTDSLDNTVQDNT